MLLLLSPNCVRATSVVCACVRVCVHSVAHVRVCTCSLLDQEKHLKLVRPALPLTGVFHVNLEEAASLAGKIYALLDRAKLVSALTSAEVRSPLCCTLLTLSVCRM